MCFGSAESTGGRGDTADVGDTGSDAERVDCLRIETGAAFIGLVVWGAPECIGAGDVAEDRVGVAEGGLKNAAEAEVVRDKTGALGCIWLVEFSNLVVSAKGGEP